MRNRNIVSLLTLALCFCMVMLYGQHSKKSSSRSSNSQRRVPVLYIPADSIAVDMSLSRPPSYVVEGKKTKIGHTLPDSSRQWLVNDISFSISYRPQGKRTLPLVLENLKVEIYIFAPGPSRDGVSYRWLCGVQKLQCVVVEPEQQRTRKYWASLFLPASYVYLHFPLERGKYNLRVLEGVVIISDKDNNILGRKAFGYRTQLTVSRAKALVDASAQLRGKKTKNQVKLWPREKTPWACLESERFEWPAVEDDQEVKPAQGNKAPAAPAGNADKEIGE